MFLTCWWCVTRSGDGVTRSGDAFACGVMYCFYIVTRSGDVVTRSSDAVTRSGDAFVDAWVRIVVPRVVAYVF